MQIWDLKALFANEKECEQNALNLQKECEKFPVYDIMSVPVSGVM